MGGVAENYGRDDDLINDIFDLDDTPTKIAPLSQLSSSKKGKSKDVDKTISLMKKKNMMKAKQRKLNTSKTHCILKKNDWKSTQIPQIMWREEGQTTECVKRSWVKAKAGWRTIREEHQ